MHILKQRFFVSSVLALLIAMLVNACNISTAHPSQSNLTVIQVLQNSSQAMQKLKTFQFTLALNGQIQGSAAASSTSTSASASPTATSSIPGSITFDVRGTGQQSLQSGEQAMTLTLNQSTHLAEVVTGHKIYVQNPRGRWYVIDPNRFAAGVSNPLAGLQLNTTTLLELVQHSQLSDHGDESLNGQSLRHITAVLDRAGLQALLKDDTQLSTLVGAQNIDAIVAHARSFQASLDLWIDETQFYLHRVQLKLSLNADTSGLVTPSVGMITLQLPPTLQATLNNTVDLSKFNEPVSISAPASAISVDNPGVIFQTS